MPTRFQWFGVDSWPIAGDCYKANVYSKCFNRFLHNLLCTIYMYVHIHMPYIVCRWDVACAVSCSYKTQTWHDDCVLRCEFLQCASLSFTSARQFVSFHSFIHALAQRKSTGASVMKRCLLANTHIYIHTYTILCVGFYIPAFMCTYVLVCTCDKYGGSCCQTWRMRWHVHFNFPYNCLSARVYVF